MMRECRLMQNDTEEKEMHACDDIKPVEANSCTSALVWLDHHDLWSSITAQHIIMFNIIYYSYVSISSVKIESIRIYVQNYSLLAITKHTELSLQWPCFKDKFTQWYQHPEYVSHTHQIILKALQNNPITSFNQGVTKHINYWTLVKAWTR